MSNEQGILHTDTFPILTFTASPAWSTVATAIPVADLRTIRLNQRGRSTSFGRQAKLYVNQKKVNQLLSNTNAADLGGYKINFAGSSTRTASRFVEVVALDRYGRVIG